MKYEWDRLKHRQNVQKHGISFEEAQTVFEDTLAVIIDDHFHSTIEQREIIVGQSAKNRLLYVVFAEHGGYIRIISARKLTGNERKRYERERFHR